MRSTVIFLAVLAAMVVAALVANVIWFVEYIPPWSFVLGMALFLAGLALGLKRKRGAVVVGLIVSCAPLLLTALNIAIGIAHDPTSHNLFPFELLIALAIGLVPAAGLSIGYAVPPARVPARGRLIAGSIAALAAVSSPAFGLLFDRRVETSVQATLRRLLAAENEYHAASPAHRFTCQGPLLPRFEHERWFAETQLGLTTPDHFQGPGGYWFMLQCGSLSRGDDVSIRAYNGYGGEFAIDASGVIQPGPQKSR